MITIEFSIPVTEIISANGREHHMKVAGKAKLLRYAAAWHAIAARQAQMPGPGVLMERANLTISVGWQRREPGRDRLTLGPTLEHCIGGAVDARVLRADDDLHLLSTTWRAYSRSEAGLVWLRLVFESVDA